MAAKQKRTEPTTPPNPLAASILQRRDPARPEISLERLEAELGDARRYDIVACLKQLERTGAGQFIVGQRGRKSRFIWASSGSGAAAAVGVDVARPRPRRTARVAVSHSSLGSTSAPAGATDAPSVLRHSFYVRPGVLSAFELPVDITGDEIERLCQLLRAIPFSARSAV